MSVNEYEIARRVALELQGWELRPTNGWLDRVKPMEEALAAALGPALSDLLDARAEAESRAQAAEAELEEARRRLANVLGVSNNEATADRLVAAADRAMLRQLEFIRVEAELEDRAEQAETALRRAVGALEEIRGLAQSIVDYPIDTRPVSTHDIAEQIVQVASLPDLKQPGDG